MNAPTPTKRAKLSYCDIDFLVKLQSTIGHRLDDATSTSNATTTTTKELTALEESFLSLLNYGADVNINLNWRRFAPPISPSLSLGLTASAGDVNCDSDDLLGSKPLHENDLVRARMDQEVLVRLLTNAGMDINCPQLAGHEDPLVLEEAKKRFNILKALVTFGTDTNRVRSKIECDEGSNNCEFCWNLQFLRNFGHYQGENNLDSCQIQNNSCGLRGLVLNALLATGSEVNAIRCGRGSSLCPIQLERDGFCSNNSHTHAITELLVTNGHKVNSSSVLCDHY